MRGSMWTGNWPRKICGDTSRGDVYALSNVAALMQRDDDTFVRGLIAHCGDAPYRYQDIRLRIVGCHRTSQGNRIRNDDEVLRFANFDFEMT